ncbi:MAG TPA: ABC-2 family transporter protein [Romboutsia sp.]|nr:ABC-2 family transporter protein [Romboutsia sp.]
MIKILTEKEVILNWSISNGIALIGIIVVWFASNRNIIGGYTKNELVSYYFFMFIYSQVIGWWVFWDVRKNIRDGSLSNFLLKPISYVKYLILQETAYKLINLITQILIGIIIYIFIKNFIVITFDIEDLAKLIPVIFIGISINFLSHFFIGCFTFFWLESYFLSDFHWIFSRFLSGLVVPLTFFPFFVERILLLNPFRFTFSLPAEIIFNQINSQDYYKVLLIGFIWVGIFVVSSMYIWKVGLRRYSAYGS